MKAASGPTGDATAFPWTAALQAGLGRLRLSSRDFWAMTPRELAFALGLMRPAQDVPDRAALASLIAAFPDDKE